MKEMKKKSNIIAIDFKKKEKIKFLFWRQKQKINTKSIIVGSKLFEYPICCKDCNDPFIGAEDRDGNVILLCLNCRKFKKVF